jgi:NADH:ubiquinone oxidoreductase subunit 2 (subunit N)
MNYLNNNFNLCFIGLYPEFFLLLGLLFAICFLVTLDNKFNYKINLINTANNLLIYILFGTLLLNNNLFNIEFSLFYDILITNNYVVLCKNFIISLFIIISILSKFYFKKEHIYIYEYFLILGLALFGLFTIISSNDLLVMYIGIEILSLSFYILTTLKLNNNFSTEAGLKYFILGSFSSGLLLYGTSLIYGATGTLNFSDIHLL